MCLNDESVKMWFLDFFIGKELFRFWFSSLKEGDELR
jgi:hypothetical protein